MTGPAQPRAAVFVVEDEPIVAADLCARLRAFGYTVTGTAMTGAKAIERITATPPDLVLMDIRLKGDLDGIDTAVHLRSRCGVPVVFLTAYAEDSTLSQAKAAEPYGYLLKPFEDVELRTTIEVAVHKSQADAEVRRLNRLYAVLSQTNQAIVRAESADGLPDLVCRVAVTHGGYPLAWVARYRDDASSPELEAVAATQPAWADACRAEFASRIARGLPARDDWTGLRAHVLRPTEESVLLELRTQAVVPIRAGTATLGVLGIHAAEAGRFGEREWDTLAEIALDLGFALENIARRAEHERTQRRLHEQERLLHVITENVRDVLALLGPDGRVLHITPSVRTLLGYDPTRLAGTRPLAVIHPDDRARAAAALRRCLDAGAATSEEFRARHRDGRHLWLEATAAPVHGADGRPSGCVLNCRDISERKHAERERAELQDRLIQSQKMEAVGQLAGGIAHDFNNILTALLMHLSLLERESALPGSLRQDFADLNSEVQRAAALTRQLLLFGRRQVIQRRTVELVGLVENLLRMLRRLIGEQVELAFDHPTGDVHLLADAGMLEQVVINLVVNARDAMPRGGTIRIMVARVEMKPEDGPRGGAARDGAFARISVEDTGCGMDAATLQRIFEPFFTTKPPGKGTGLGLATVFSIAEQHAGWIEVASEPGRGSQFHIFLPALPPVAAPSELPAPSGAVAGGRERVLVVEDERGVRRLVVNVLRRLGYDVAEVQTAQQALDWIAGMQRADLVITDAVMPGGLSGLDLAERLRALPEPPRIILMSGYSEEIARHGLEKLPGARFLAKPFDIAQLAALVRESLGTPAA